MTEMLAKRDALTLPLKGHGYLLTIIAGFSEKAEAKKEAQIEAARGGRTPVGGAPAPAPAQPAPTAPAAPATPRKPMPAAVKQALIKGGFNDANQ